MKKIYSILLGLFLCMLLSYTTAINLINILYYQRLSWTLDYSLLFVNNSKIIFVVATLISLALWSEIIWARIYSKGSKRRLTKSEKQRSSHIASLKELKPSLIRVSFDKDKIIETRQDKYDIKMNSFYKCTKNIETKFQDKYKVIFRTDKVIKIPLLSRYNLNHPVRKQYSIGGEKKWKRSGLIFSAGESHAYVDPADNHNLVIGKSFTEVLEMLELSRLSGESVIVNDPKGELAKYTRKKFEQSGYQTYVLNFVDPEYSNCWNPFELAWIEWKEAEKKAEQKIKEYKKEFEKKKAKCKLLGLPEPEMTDL